MDGLRIRKDCRLCYGVTDVALELAPTPPANELVTKEFVDSGQKQDEFPLPISVCRRCGHVQLAAVVDPDRLFRSYVYTSGVSPVFVEHLRLQADEVIRSLGLKPGDLVVEIGSNDGTLLKFFQEKGMRVLGVDPARNITEIANAAGVETLPEFFTSDLAVEILLDRGPAKAILANNVFAHSDHLDNITAGIAKLLHPEGAFVFEVGYFPLVVQRTMFDTIYHEHLSYHHLSPLHEFFAKHALHLHDAKIVESQGGSVRGYVGHKTTNHHNSLELDRLLDEETKHGFRTYLDPRVTGLDPVLRLSRKIDVLKADLTDVLTKLKGAGKSIAGFGAPAKCVTLMHQFGFGSEVLDFIAEDSVHKQSLYVPGKGIPILPTSAIYERRPDYVVILAWNFADSVMQRNARFRDEGGKFVVPIPEVRVHG